jgi:hypothetical protein
MALICPNCKARNRSVAKFCIECITSLPTGCADTDFAPTMLAASRSSYLGLPSLKGRWTKAAARPKPEAATHTPPVPKGMWISIAGLATALIIGSAGWLVLGAGGWYLYTAGSAQVDPPRPVPPAATSPVEERAESPAPVPPAQEPDHAPAQLAAPVTDNADAPYREVEGPVSARATQAARKAASGKVPAASPALRDLSAPTASETPPAETSEALSKPRAVTEPAAACASLNFIAAARCMAAQCVKREFRSHAQCEAVRRQQRLEEEKRNPQAP